MQADEVQNAKEPIAAQIDLSGQTLSRDKSGRGESKLLWPGLAQRVSIGETRLAA